MKKKIKRKLTEKKVPLVLFPILVILLIIVISNNTQASSNITGIVCDYNTMNRLENVSINIYQGSTLHSTISTNTNGQFSFLNLTASNYTITFTLSNYEGQTNDINLVDNTTTDLLIKLIPFSYNAIIKLTFNDLGLNLNDVCFYSGNGRLHGCYEMNESITLYEHQDYYVIIKPKDIDIIRNPVQSGITIMNYSENIFRFVFIIIILLLIVSIFYHFIKKM